MLNDQELSTLLRDAYDDAASDVTAPAGMATAVRRRYGTTQRIRLAAAVAVPLAAATAVAGVALTNWPGSPMRGTGPAPLAESGTHVSTDPGTIRLAGYTFTLPAAFHATSGSCTVTLLPGMEAHAGVVGTDGGCIAIYRTQTKPGFVDGDPRCDTNGLGREAGTRKEGAVTYTYVRSKMLTFVSSVPASHGGGYVVVARSRGVSKSTWLSRLEPMVENALGPALRAC